MTARFQFRALTSLAATLAVFGCASAGAQANAVRRPPRPDTPFMTVQVFRSSDRIAGPAASDALRERLIQVYPGPVLWVIDKEQLVALLEQSGYPTNEQLGRTDENSLAKFQRADEYIRGSVTREADGRYRVDAQLVLTRDATLTQPLPPSRGTRPERAAVGLVRSVQDARRQLVQERRCLEHARNQRYAQALAEADKAIEDYPDATLVRYCKLNVLARQQAGHDEILKVADEILAIDPNSRNALAMAADAHKANGDVDRANELLVRLLAAEPNNTTLATQVVDALAASRRYDVAKEIVLKAVQDNPGDVALVRLQFLILSSAGDYKPAIATGEEMIQLDTAMADQPFFTRLTALYMADSQPTMAADAARRGTVKFPRNPDLWQLYAQTLRTSGQVRESVAAARKALEINPNIPNGWIQVTQAYIELQESDSALAALRMATQVGDNADFIASLASGIGNQKRLRGVADTNVTVLQESVALLQWSDSVAMLRDSVGPPEARRARVQASPETRSRVKFILGAAAVTLGQTAATVAVAPKSCALARVAEEALIVAQIALPGGGAFNPDATAQLMGAVPQISEYVGSQIKAFCK
ncbi:MAG: tetratricopeptide repeat protein [Gemmatimonadaceae bacterium]